MTYITKRILWTDFCTDESLQNFCAASAEIANQNFGGKYNWVVDLQRIANEGLFLVCYRDEKPVGFLLATFNKNFFDPDIKVLRQNMLFSLPNTRAPYLLLKEFIDFGKVNANHIITNIGPKTNIKGESLEKLGFKKLEELYRIEV